jgi:hypothetical protein
MIWFPERSRGAFFGLSPSVCRNPLFPELTGFCSWL